jgi:hypothetical protein
LESCGFALLLLGIAQRHSTTLLDSNGSALFPVTTEVYEFSLKNS